jgi:hypothetical protein
LVKASTVASSAATCDIDYNFAKISGQNAFSGTINIKNTSNQTINGWTLRFQWAHGQQIQTDTGINNTQSGPNGRNVAATDVGGAGGILSPGEVTQTSFTASFDGVVNSRPPNFTLNNRPCTTPQQSNRWQSPRKLVGWAGRTSTCGRPFLWVAADERGVTRGVRRLVVPNRPHRMVRRGLPSRLVSR